MPKGLFFAFEGIDGSGKSTQIALFKSELQKKGMQSHETREPTDGPVGSVVRQLLTGRIAADPRVIAGLFAADRLDHLTNCINGLCREIEQGITILSDRYYFSSYAYNALEMDMDWVIELNRCSADLLRPTAHIFIDIPVELAMERIKKNRIYTELYEKEERLRMVRKQYYTAFDKLAGKERIIVVDGTGSVETVFDRICQAVNPLLTDLNNIS